MNYTIDLLITMVTDEIAEETGKDRKEILTDFLCSKTGKALYDEKTKLWCNGPAYIAELYREELKKSGYQIWDECISVCLCWEINSYKIIVYADTLFVKVLTVFIQS